MHWWAELWDNWAKMFGYDHWEWGSASDAFAAIGTVGALAVTLHIVRKDRRDRAQALARGVTGWWEADEGGVPIDEDDPSTIGRIATALTVTVRNSSAHPVTVLTASYLRRGTGGAYLSVAGTSGAYLSVGGDPSRTTAAGAWVTRRRGPRPRISIRPASAGWGRATRRP